MKKFYLILLALLALFTTAATAQSTVGNKYQVNGLYYRVTSLSPNKVKVVSELEPTNSSDPHYTPANEPTGNVVIPSSIFIPLEGSFAVTEIDRRAFYKCANITSLTIPEGVKTIRSSALSHCTQLTSITFPESVTSISSYVLAYNTALASVTLPSSLTTISEGLFDSCSALETLNIPESVWFIERGALYNTGLTAITLPNGLTTITEYLFGKCHSLTTITIPENAATIKNNAFANCSNLTTIKLPSTLTSIGEKAFADCRMLANIESKVADPNNITLNGIEIFDNVGMNVTGGTTVYVPVGSKALYENADQWQNFNIEEGSVGTHPISKSQINLTITGNTLALANLPTNEVVKIYTLTGELMHQVAANSNHNPQITLPQGTYIIQVGQYTDKVIIK